MIRNSLFNIRYSFEPCWFVKLALMGVTPCPLCQDIVVGNIHQESLVDIFNRNRETLLFDFEIKGRCGDCENNDICFGCRANAFYMAGDMRASDPRCWLNPDNKAEYLLKKTF